MAFAGESRSLSCIALQYRCDDGPPRLVKGAIPSPSVSGAALRSLLHGDLNQELDAQLDLSIQREDGAWVQVSDEQIIELDRHDTRVLQLNVKRRRRAPSPESYNPDGTGGLLAADGLGSAGAE